MQDIYDLHKTGRLKIHNARPMHQTAVRADLLARTPAGIVHVEFVKDHTPSLDLRMVEYWLRLRGQDRDTPVDQYVLVLGDDVEVPDRCIDRGREVLSWSVVRLGELDPTPLLVGPTTAAIAALARGTQTERAGVLTAAAELIAATDPDRGRKLLGAAATLASIVLPGPSHWHSVEGGGHACSGS